MCFGITFSIAMVISKGSVNGKEILRTLFSSMPFVTYLVMILLCAAQIHLPQPVYTVAGMIGQANSFLAMLLIGILFEPKINRSERKDMAGVFLLRMALGIAFSLLIYLSCLYRCGIVRFWQLLFFAHFECCADLYGTLRL